MDINAIRADVEGEACWILGSSVPQLFLPTHPFPPKLALTLFDVLSYSSSRWWRGNRGENAAVASGAENQISINSGLPVGFIHRGVLSQTSYGDAIRFVQDIKHASGQNYIIGGTEEVSSWECSANKVVRFWPYEGATRLYHNNHPLANDDQSIYQQILEKIPPEKRPPARGNSEIRYEALEKRLKKPSEPVTVDTFKETFSSRDDPENPVCRIKPEDGSGGFTAGCSIMVLSKPPELYFAPGPACVKELKIYRF